MKLSLLNDKIRFDRNELSGAFGDIGTDLPLIIGMVLVSGIDTASVLIVFGSLQIFTGILYGIPMPVQPLKALAAIVIAQKLSDSVIYGAGLAIGITMLILVITGLIDWLTKTIPKIVIRGIQFGLGLQLALLGLQNYVKAEKIFGYVLAGISFIITISLIGNRKYPPALFLIAFGIIYAFLFKIDISVFKSSFGFSLPEIHIPTLEDMIQGFVLLALPQIPLSLGNSILATHKIVNDFFPEKKFTVKKIGFTYSLMNIISPFVSGIPTCHGSGGIAGHYAFGARTGGSIIIYGSMYIILGLFFSLGFTEIIQVFPLPILGVILFFEGLTLMKLLKDTTDSVFNLSVALMVGLIAVGLPYGYAVGLLAGTAIIFISNRYRINL
jgi:hypothetical protein